MARTRNIKPSFFLNTKLAELGPLCRILFSGLWCIADREGRLEDNPKKIKAQLLPYDNCNTDDLLQQLHDSEFIHRYKVDRLVVIYIENFLKHQTPHHKEKSSELPAPTKASTSTDLGSHASPPLTLNPSSSSLNPHTLNPSTEIVCMSDDDQDKRHNSSTLFDEVSALYPSGYRTPYKARMVWGAKQLYLEADAIKEGVDAWVQCDKWKRGVIMNFDTFLDGECWKDKPEPAIVPMF